MKQNVHLLDPKIALIVGPNAALVYNKIMYYCEYHQAEGTNLHDGLHWSYNTRKGMAKQFIYLSERQIRTALEKLIEKGLILVGNYNKFANDRTLWYAINPNFHLTQKSNANDTEVKSDLTQKSSLAFDTEVTALPIDTHSPPPREVEEVVVFEDFWKAYPRTDAMNKDKARSEWVLLRIAEKKQAIHALAGLKSTLDKMQGGGYMPFVYLRDKVFNRVSAPPPKRNVDAPAEGTPSRELYEFIAASYGDAAWISWFANCEIDEALKTIHPHSKLNASRLGSSYGAALEGLGWTIGSVRERAG